MSFFRPIQSYNIQSNLIWWDSPFKRKGTCRLHRRSLRAYNKNSPRTLFWWLIKTTCSFSFQDAPDVQPLLILSNKDLPALLTQRNLFYRILKVVTVFFKNCDEQVNNPLAKILLRKLQELLGPRKHLHLSPLNISFCQVPKHMENGEANCHINFFRFRYLKGQSNEILIPFFDMYW
jgi:hypothetical protein